MHASMVPRRSLFTRCYFAGHGNVLLADRFRSGICLKDKGYHILHNAINKTQICLRVFSSFGPQEANLCSEEISKNKFLVDCGTDQECAIGGIVALGKFDALHIGHRELAVQASKAGVPFLLSFIGMAEVLGWEPRPPIVPKCDRKRIFSSWASYCGNQVPQEYQVEFKNVRHLTPQQFVEKLSKELRIGGVVAGENYRFGYKASGDTKELVRLCKEYGMSAYIVRHVMDKTHPSDNGSSTSLKGKDSGQVSSTRVRQALATGDMEYVAQLLGRRHRLILMLNKECDYTGGRKILAPKSCLLNQPPRDGEFDKCTLLVDDVVAGPCRVVIDAEKFNIELDDGCFLGQDVVRDGRLIGVEFG